MYGLSLHAEAKIQQYLEDTRVVDLSKRRGKRISFRLSELMLPLPGSRGRMRDY